MIRQSKELQIGKAGEYIVCADLILKGFISFPSEQGLPYDVLLDNGKKIIRIQVKTTEKPRIIPQRNKKTEAYIFNVKRSGSNGKTRYDISEIDLFALVCLDTMQIGYIKNKEMPETLNLRVDKLRGTYYDEDGSVTFKKAIELKKSGLNNRQISKELNKHESLIGRYLKEGYKPYKTNAVYFSDLKKDKQWFQTL